MSAEQTVPSAGDQEHPSPHRDKTSLLELWAGLMVAPAAWFVQMSVETPLLSQSCYPSDEPYTGALAGLATVVLVVDALALLIAVAGFLIALRTWRHTAGEKAGRGQSLISSGDGRSRFMAMSGMFMSALIAFAILYAGLAHALLPQCGL